MKHRALYVCISFAVVVIVWKAVAFAVDAPLIVPSPASVMKEFARDIKSAAFWLHMSVTLFRCLFAFCFSTIFGTAIGALSGISERCRYFFLVPIAAIRSTPVVSIILLALFWFNSSLIPVFVSFLMTFPVMAENVLKGFICIDSRLFVMARMYGFNKYQRIKWITAPAISPFFFSGLVATFGTTWKVVAAGEVLCLPRLGIGVLLHTAQVHLETAQVAAFTFALVLMSFLLEQCMFFIFRSCFMAQNERKHSR